MGAISQSWILALCFLASKVVCEHGVGELLKPTWSNQQMTSDGKSGPFAKETMSVQTTFTDLPPHTLLQVRVRYWILDTWDASDYSFITVDGERVITLPPSGSINTCDDPWLIGYPDISAQAANDCYMDVAVKIPHNVSFANIEIGGVADQGLADEGWAFENFLAWVEGDISDIRRWPVDGEIESDGISLHGPFGGEQISKTRVFAGLFPHNTLEIRVRYWAIDSWDSSQGVDHGFISVDGVVLVELERDASVCPGEWVLASEVIPDYHEPFPECYMDVTISLAHTQDAVTVEIGAILDSPIENESWAFSNFLLWTE